MKKLLLSLLLFSSVQALSPEGFLEKRIPLDNGRYDSFLHILHLLEERKAKTLVETGTQRWKDPKFCFSGDGGGTIIFGHWATENDAFMYSIDINETHVQYAKENTKDYASHLTILCQDSVEFLEHFAGPIDFLYLDSFDYSESNPDPAQRHCLREVLAAYEKLSPEALIMIDDCNVPGGGKGKLAIAWLIEQGWHLCINRHHVILSR